MRFVLPIPYVILASVYFCSGRSFAMNAASELPHRLPNWREPSRVALAVGGGKTGETAKWTIELGKHGDFLLEVAKPSEGGATVGTILAVGGQAMAVTGLELETGYEMDALDMPAFHFQLLYELLETLFPKGPGSLSPAQDVEHAENDVPISVGTASATGEFAAPWFVKGTVTRHEDTGADFDLRFTFTVDRETATTFTLHLLGTWDGRPQKDVVPDELGIDGWSVFAIGPYEVETADGIVIEYGAQALNNSYRTVGELRAALEEGDEGIDGE